MIVPKIGIVHAMSLNACFKFPLPFSLWLHGSIQLVDQFLVAAEFRHRYVFFGQVYGVIYLLFNVGWYYLAPKEDRQIYVILDWENKPLVACIYGLGLLFIGAPLFAVLHCGVYR